MGGKAMVFTDKKATPLSMGELMQVDGKESLQVENISEEMLRLFVTISPIGSKAFAEDADI
jgi:hypothetical protein